jgi:hypothetical protein
MGWKADIIGSLSAFPLLTESGKAQTEYKTSALSGKAQTEYKTSALPLKADVRADIASRPLRAKKRTLAPQQTNLDDLVGGSVPNVHMPACAERNILEFGRGRNRPSYVNALSAIQPPATNPHDPLFCA